MKNTEIRGPIWAGVALAALLLFACGATGPQYPSPPYFDSAPAAFADGDVSLGEPFLDLNANGIRDPDYMDPYGNLGEPFTDYSGDGQWTSALDPWAGQVPFIDLNLNGHFDVPNGVFDRLWSRGRDEPWVHAIITEGETVCVPVTLTTSPNLLRIEALASATFDAQAAAVCLTPEASGPQTLTVIGTNGRGESGTLTITAYATLRPVLDSIVPAVIQRGAMADVTLYTRNGHYPTLLPVFPPGVVEPGSMMWSEMSGDRPRIWFRVREDAPLGAHEIGLTVPDIMSSSNTVTLEVIE